MAINYAKMRATAKRLITENGTKFYGERPGRIDHVGGEEVMTPPVELVIVGVQTEYKPQEIDSKLILSGDKKIIATADVEVKVGDVFTIDGSNWRVENPNPVKPAAIVLNYKIQLRGV